GAAQLVQCPLDGGAGEGQVPRDGPDGRPTLAVPAGSVLQIHIDRPGPVAHVRAVDVLKIAHVSSCLLRSSRSPLATSSSTAWSLSGQRSASTVVPGGGSAHLGSLGGCLWRMAASSSCLLA